MYMCLSELAPEGWCQ